MGSFSKIEDQFSFKPVIVHTWQLYFHFLHTSRNMYENFHQRSIGGNNQKTQNKIIC